MNIVLTEEDRADIHNKHLISAKNVEVGERYFYRAKIGGERKVMTVQVKRPTARHAADSLSRARHRWPK